ncbi:MAG: AraC family transcriptional regulator [Lachnospiraceae bacterium]|nr:AraC family transcriptional regulator [Lachnospiraceae bacterium]
MNTKRRFINVNFTMSYEEHEEGFTMPEFHFHNDYEIYILERGTRIVSIGEDTFTAGAGDVVLFASEVPHKSKGSEGFAGICIHLSERYLKRYFTADTIERFKRLFSAKVIHISESSMSVIREMTQNFVIEDEDNFYRLARVFEILNAEMKSQADGQSRKNACGEPNLDVSGNTVVAGKRTKKTDEIFAYVEENYAYIKTIAELAEHFDVSESYLFRIFKHRHDMTPKTYINKLRIKNICKRLKYSEGTIKSVVAEYGFESYEYFSRVFKKEMGCGPREWNFRIKNRLV